MLNDRMRLEELKDQLSEDERLQFDLMVRGKQRDRGMMILLTCLGFLGVAGIQRFMLGQIGWGIAYLLTAGFCWIGTIVDLVKISDMTDEYNTKMEYDELQSYLALKHAREERDRRRASGELPGGQGGA